MDRSTNSRKMRQSGLWGWWLSISAPPGTLSYELAATKEDQERLRKAGLLSAIAPFVFIAPLLLLQQVQEVSTLVAIIILMIMATTALLFNRLGKQRIAALLLIFTMDAVIEGALIKAQGGLSSGWLLSFDLFVIPLSVTGILLSRNYLWSFAVLHIAFILGDFYLLPHTPDLVALIKFWGSPSVTFARPIIIQVGICLLSFLEVRSTDEAINRANRAEEVAKLEHSIAQQQVLISQQKEELEQGIEKISQVLTYAAGGHFNVRVELPQKNILWLVATKINTLFARLNSSKNAESTLRQTEQEVQKITEAIHSIRNGHQAILPHSFSGITEPLIQELRMAITEITSNNTPQNTNNRDSKNLSPKQPPFTPQW